MSHWTFLLRLLISCKSSTFLDLGNPCWDVCWKHLQPPLPRFCLKQGAHLMCQAEYLWWEHQVLPRSRPSRTAWWGHSWLPWNGKRGWFRSVPSDWMPEIKLEHCLMWVTHWHLFFLASFVWRCWRYLNSWVLSEKSLRGIWNHIPRHNVGAPKMFTTCQAASNYIQPA